MPQLQLPQHQLACLEFCRGENLRECRMIDRPDMQTSSPFSQLTKNTKIHTTNKSSEIIETKPEEGPLSFGHSALGALPEASPKKARMPKCYQQMTEWHFGGSGILKRKRQRRRVVTASYPAFRLKFFIRSSRPLKIPKLLPFGRTRCVPKETQLNWSNCPHNSFRAPRINYNQNSQNFHQPTTK